jgi:hypothetical protein
MQQMTDPSAALASFQQALIAGDIAIQPGALDKAIFVHSDRPNGYPRLTYVRLKGRNVTALVMYVRIEPIDDIPTYAVGYAVPDQYRAQGRAKDIIGASVTELTVGLARNGIARFYIEAVIGVDNLASQRVAAATLNAHPTSITDSVSGQPALHYLRLVE